jgi:hypothetical protein
MMMGTCNDNSNFVKDIIRTLIIKMQHKEKYNMKLGILHPTSSFFIVTYVPFPVFCVGCV